MLYQKFFINISKTDKRSEAKISFSSSPSQSTSLRFTKHELQNTFILLYRIITSFLTSQFVRFRYGAIVVLPSVRFAVSLAQPYKTQVSCRGLARALTAKITNSLYSR